jgi:CelD/BcsL family acetyltransferase involved in cellulose biosynthesis
VAPFFAARGAGGVETLAPLASGASFRGEPVALPGREQEAAGAVADVLAETGARVVRIEGAPETSPWPAALAYRWPGQGAKLSREQTMPSPFVSLEGDLDSWLASRTASFRNEMRRQKKRGDEAGATVRRAVNAEEARLGVRELARLHRERWTPRGGSAVIDDRVEAMLVDASEGLLAHGRLRLYVMELDERIVAANLFLAAGGEVASWLSGFDGRAARLAPAMRNRYAALEEAFELGDRRLDLGGGGQEYKYRFADGDELLIWWTLVPAGRSALATRARLLPSRVLTAARRRLGERQKAALRRILRR